jgi:hypothetical protein
MQPKALLERRMIPSNNEPVVQWLIKWINLPETTATWEDVDFIKKVFSRVLALRTRLSKGEYCLHKLKGFSHGVSGNALLSNFGDAFA